MAPTLLFDTDGNEIPLIRGRTFFQGSRRGPRSGAPRQIVGGARRGLAGRGATGAARLGARLPADLSTPSDLRADPARAFPHTAGFLSFLWPGLGQWYQGRNRTAALFALPVIGIALVLLLQAVGSVGQLASLIITPSSALTVVILIGLLAAWRLLAIADAMSFGDVKARIRHRPLLAFTALALGVVLMHGAMGYAAWGGV